SPGSGASSTTPSPPCRSATAPALRSAASAEGAVSNSATSGDSIGPASRSVSGEVAGRGRWARSVVMRAPMPPRCLRDDEGAAFF
ncbi:hypothetical protein HMPREF0731_4754, partial [Pseudoroseomonas cervicalis ATCC 49957]